MECLDHYNVLMDDLVILFKVVEHLGYYVKEASNVVMLAYHDFSLNFISQ